VQSPPADLAHVVYRDRQFPFRQTELMHSDKRSRFAPLRTPLDALDLRVPLGFVVAVQIVRHRANLK
jgi:hypothetical protein